MHTIKSYCSSIRLDLLARAGAPKNKESEDFMDIFGTDPYEAGADFNTYYAL